MFILRTEKNGILLRAAIDSSFMSEFLKRVHTKETLLFGSLIIFLRALCDHGPSPKYQLTFYQARATWKVYNTLG